MDKQSPASSPLEHGKVQIYPPIGARLGQVMVAIIGGNGEKVFWSETYEDVQSAHGAIDAARRILTQDDLEIQYLPLNPDVGQGLPDLPAPPEIGPESGPPEPEED